VVAVVVSLCVAVVWLGSPRAGSSEGGVAFEVVAIAGGWMSMLVANRLYLARCVERMAEEVRRIVSAGAVAVAGYLIVCYLVGAAPAERGWVIGSFVAVSAGLVVERSAARVVFHRLRRRGRSVRRIAIVGSDAHALALHRSFVDDTDAYDVVGLIGDVDVMPSDVRMLGGYERAVEILREHDCSGAVVSLASLSRVQVNSVVRALSDAKMHVALSTSMRDIDVHRLRAQEMDGEVLMYVEPTVRTGWRMYAKRTLDLVLSSVALMLCLPVLVVIAVLIKLDSPGPVLFRQARVGRDGRLFDMLKLRTMCVDAEARLDELNALNEASGPLFKIRQDPRITRLGRLLRRFSLDEIPQFWNVIRGEMSLVGPRPALDHEVAEWDPELRKRLEVPPGLSGLWQVSGRSDTTFEQYRRLDLYYVDNWTLGHDLRVIAKTIWVVLTARGAT
jgi:exopolysaccharide biosynthesis polyprenyl glycosylphosphotransferase